MLSMKDLSTPGHLEIFPHGAHEGRAVEAVMDEAPAYILWWAKNVEGFAPIKPSIVEACARDVKHQHARLRHLAVEETGEMLDDPLNLTDPEDFD